VNGFATPPFGLPPLGTAHGPNGTGAADAAAAEQAAGVIETVVERVFHAVTAVRDRALEAHRAAREHGAPLCGRDVAAMGGALSSSSTGSATPWASA
jgi:hypothetical protein